MLTQQ
jgi:hypothetical protein